MIRMSGSLPLVSSCTDSRGTSAVFSDGDSMGITLTSAEALACSIASISATVTDGSVEGAHIPLVRVATAPAVDGRVESLWAASDNDESDIGVWVSLRSEGDAPAGPLSLTTQLFPLDPSRML